MQTALSTTLKESFPSPIGLSQKIYAVLAVSIPSFNETFPKSNSGALVRRSHTYAAKFVSTFLFG